MCYLSFKANWRSKSIQSLLGATRRPPVGSEILQESILLYT